MSVALHPMIFDRLERTLQMNDLAPVSLASIRLDELRREADAEHLANLAGRRAGAPPALSRESALAIWISRLQAGLLR
jgi:hypothetical protein